MKDEREKHKRQLEERHCLKCDAEIFGRRRKYCKKCEKFCNSEERKMVYRHDKKEAQKHDSEFDYTDKEIFAGLDQLYNFTLDAAASDEHHVCDDYLSRDKRDAFTTDWYGRVFVNPSWESGLNKWVARALDQSKSPKVQLVVMLLPDRPRTKWFRMLQKASAHISLLTGKMRFEGDDTVHTFTGIVASFGREA
jgi:phage N-6-adenine-methyltransferase